MVKRFPIYKAGHIFNKFESEIPKNIILKHQEIQIKYPCRLNAMAIDPSVICYNEEMIFTSGEVVISINKKIKVNIRVINNDNGQLIITNKTKRKVLVKHAYFLITKVLNVTPSLEIDVDDNEIPKHSGFGSSSSTITAVIIAINELYGCPLKNDDLIKYLASNHGEEINGSDDDNLKLVQSIGGGATNGLVEEGIIIIAGRATTIAKLKFDSDVLVGIPKGFQEKNADELMKLEEENLWKFEKTGKKYANEIAYNILHKALPDMTNGNIKSLAQVVFDYRFNMGSIKNCSFVYEGMNEIADEIRELFENGDCEFLALSSVGPAFFVLVKDEKQKKVCKQKMEELNMNVIETEVFNKTYECEVLENNNVNYWEKISTANDFTQRPLSKYITDTIDGLLNLGTELATALDIGCGGGRYTRYLSKLIDEVYAVDKYEKMAFSLNENNVYFAKSDMGDLIYKNNMFDLILSIGVIHNASSLKQYEASITEIQRLLKIGKYAIISVFTNDLIDKDLIKVSTNKYNILNRPSMILLSKNDINDLLFKNKLKIIKIIDEHLTDVGSGKRNVYSVLIQK